MLYNFIKNSFDSIVSSREMTFAALENFLTFKENKFLLNHNIDAIYKTLKFLKSPENIFIINGFMGSGKTSVVDVISDFLSEEVLVFKNSYQEAINPDDILLSLYKTFSMYQNENRVNLPKTDTSVFSDKINTYIKYCNVPMLFIFDSFEINMKNQDTQKDIIDFINYLSKFSKAKIIICSRTFSKKDLPDQSIIQSCTLQSLTLDEYNNFLTVMEITDEKTNSENLFNEARGHFLLIEMSVLVMNLLNISLDIFYNEFQNSKKNFLEFLISKILSFSSDKFQNLLVFLAELRHGASLSVIINNKLADKDDVEFLLQKRVIAEKSGQYYLKDYLKKEFLKTANVVIRAKINKLLIKLYEDELPLKPFERKLFLSRLTMRQEIAFHTECLESLSAELAKVEKNKLPETLGLNYLNYKQNNKAEKPVQPKKYLKKFPKKSQIQMGIIDYTNTISENVTSSFNYSLDNSAKEVEKTIELDSENVLDYDTDLENIPDGLNDFVNIADKYERAFNFSGAIMYYKKALTYNTDKDFDDKQPYIYSKLAVCYKKIQEIDEAVKMYEKVYSLYINTDSDKANFVLLQMAKMYSEIYKFDKSKELYNRILYSVVKPSYSIKIRTYLDLSELEDNSHNIAMALKYAQAALSEAEKSTDIKLLAECYFKYAILLDDSGKTDVALKYYLRCTQISNNPEENLYISSAYNNLAELSIENKNLSAAKMYYELSIEADKKQNNNEGLYYSYTKLAKIHKKNNPERCYEYLINALYSAKKLDDISYTVSAYLDLGDYYVSSGDFKRALKSYILAKTLLPKHSEQEIIVRVSKSISKIRLIKGEVAFENLLEEIKKKK